MRYIFTFCSIISLLIIHTHGVYAEGTGTPQTHALITSPIPGQPLQGTVSVNGSTQVDGFQSAELSFGYSNDPTHTWFLISQRTDPVTDGLLAEWDTTTLTDGNYGLRLVVYRVDGSQLEVLVQGLRLRNYSPIETGTPVVTPTPAKFTSSSPGESPPRAIKSTPTLTPIRPTTTPLPANPAQLSLQDVTSGLGKGVIGVLAIFIIIGLYLTVRRIIQR
jgi:hypothetical protein